MRSECAEKVRLSRVDVEISRELREEFKRIVLESHLSLEEIAELFRVHASTVRNWLSGRVTRCQEANYKGILRFLKTGLAKKAGTALSPQEVSEPLGETSDFFLCIFLAGFFLPSSPEVSEAQKQYLDSLEKLLDACLEVAASNAEESPEESESPEEKCTEESMQTVAAEEEIVFDGELSEEFCNRLRERRNGFHLTQQELSKLLGVSRECVSLWENGYVNRCYRRHIGKLKDFLNGRYDLVMLRMCLGRKMQGRLSKLMTGSVGAVYRKIHSLQNRPAARRIFLSRSAVLAQRLLEGYGNALKRIREAHSDGQSASPETGKQ